MYGCGWVWLNCVDGDCGAVQRALECCCRRLPQNDVPCQMYCRENSEREGSVMIIVREM